MFQHFGNWRDMRVGTNDHRFSVIRFSKNGQPYVAEAHDPDQAVWIYDSPNQPTTQVGNDLNRITFPAISTQALRIIVTP